MSVREAQLCDHHDCNSPSVLTCPLCKRDSCKTHCGSNYLAVTVVMGHTGNAMASFLGKTRGIGICGDCSAQLNNDTRVIVVVLLSLVEQVRGERLRRAAAHERVADETAEHKVNELHRGTVSGNSYGVNVGRMIGTVVVAGMIVTCPTGITVTEWRQQRPLVRRSQSWQPEGNISDDAAFARGRAHRSGCRRPSRSASSPWRSRCVG